MGKRVELLAAVQFLWELARFLGLFALAGLRFRPDFAEDPATVLWLLALASAQLLAPALLALFLYSPERRQTLLPFLRLSKLLQVFPVLLLAIALATRPGPALPSLPLFPPRLALAAALAAASAVDLLFLLLHSLRGADRADQGKAPAPAASDGQSGTPPEGP